MHTCIVCESELWTIPWKLNLYLCVCDVISDVCSVCKCVCSVCVSVRACTHVYMYVCMMCECAYVCVLLYIYIVCVVCTWAWWCISLYACMHDISKLFCILHCFLLLALAYQVKESEGACISNCDNLATKKKKNPKQLIMENVCYLMPYIIQTKSGENT